MNDLYIKKKRLKLGISQDELAKKIGVSIRTVQNWEAGKVIPKSKYAILQKLFCENSDATVEPEQFDNDLFEVVKSQQRTIESLSKTIELLAAK